MPPKRTASSTSKRKASPSEDDQESQSQSKKAKTSTPESGGLAPNGQPTNKVLPEVINFPEKNEGTWRIASWNVSSLAAAQKKVDRAKTDSNHFIFY